MLDRSVPYISLVMTRRGDSPRAPAPAWPLGYRAQLYSSGCGQDWARIETAAGEFDTQENARAYFKSTYENAPDLLAAHLQFAVGPDGSRVGNCMLWRHGNGTPMLHWLAVQPDHGGKGIATALVREILCLHETMNPGENMVLHTQTWSYHAVGIYVSHGFQATLHSPFPEVKSDWDSALPILRGKMRTELYEKMVCEMS